MGYRARSAEQILTELFAKGTRTETGCLICHLTPNAKGYIPVQVGGRGGKKWRANRFVLHMTKGSIPDALGALHTCDNRQCIEPEHLYAGTPLQNSSDMVDRNRQARLGRPPIHEATLLETTELYKSGMSYAQIAHYQGLAGPSSVADRLRRARNAGIN